MIILNEIKYGNIKNIILMLNIKIVWTEKKEQNHQNQI